MLSHSFRIFLTSSVLLLAAGCVESPPASDLETHSQTPIQTSTSKLRPNASQALANAEDSGKGHPHVDTLDEQHQTSARVNQNERNEKPVAPNDNWPHWRGPNRDGTSTETGLIHQFPKSGPKVLWRKPLGTGFSGLSIFQGKVFTLFGEDNREKIACFKADTGDEVWKIDSDEDFAKGRSFGPRATPCVDGKLLYTVGASGRLDCREAATGKSVWSFNLYEKYGMRSHDEGLSCSPLIDGKRLIVAAGTSVFAFDKSNGDLIWRVLDEKMNHSTPTFGTIDGRRQLLVLTGSNLVGLAADSGNELWRHPQGAVNCVTPVLGPDNQIFVAAAYGFGCQLVKISDSKPTLMYKNSSLATHHATAMLYKGHLYGFHDRPGIFKCIEFDTGDEKWVSRMPGKGKLIIADGQMIIITEYGELVLATPSPDGYLETAKAKLLDGTCYTAPTLVNGKLYIRSDKELVCIDMKNQ